MKKNTAKILIFLFATGLFIWPVFVLGAVNYERTPAGYFINSPINFQISLDSFSEVCPDIGDNFWGIIVSYEYNLLELPDEYWLQEVLYVELVNKTTLSNNFIINLPDYYRALGIYGVCAPVSRAESGYNFFTPSGLLEYNSGSPIFEIIPVAQMPAGKILTISSGAVGDVLIYPKTFWNDLWKIITLVIGLPIAFFLLNKLINLTTPKTK